MATIAKLDVVLGFIDESFTKGIAGADDKLRSLGANLTKTGKYLTAGVTLPLVGAGLAAVNWASDFDQAIGKSEAVFGDQSDAVVEWSKGTAKAFGFARSDAIGMAATYGSLFKVMGMTNDVAADQSMQLIGLSADMAAFNDVSNSRASEALMAGLSGEYMSLRSLGVFLDEATVSTEALAIAQADGRDEVTQADKVQARYNLLLEQTAQQQGQAAREANNWASRMAQVKAQIKDTGTAIGLRLMPYALKFLDFLEKAVQFFERLNPTIKTAALVFAGLAAVLGPLLIIVGTILSVFGLLGLALMLLVGIAVGAWGRDIADVFSRVVDWVQQFAESVQTLMSHGLNPLEAILLAISLALARIGGDNTPEWIAALSRAFQAFAAGNYGDAFRAIADAARAAFDEILNLASVALDWVLDTGIPTVIGWVVDVAGDVWGGIKALAGWAWDNKGAIANWVIDVAAPTITGWITSIAGRVGDWLIGLMSGGSIVGDGTGGPSPGGSSSFTASLNDWTLRVALPKITGLFEAAQEFARGVGVAIRGIDWMTVFREALGDSFKIGTVVGEWVRQGLNNISMSDLVDVARWAIIGALIMTAIIGGLVLLPIVIAGALIALMGSALIGFAEGITGLDFSQIAANTWNGIVAAMQSGKDQVISFFMEIMAQAVAITAAMWSSIKGQYEAIKSVMTTAISTAKTSVVSTLESLKTEAITKITQWWTSLKAQMESIKSAITTKLEEAKTSATSTMTSMVHSLGAVLSGFVGTARSLASSIGSGIVNGIRDGIAGLIPGLASWFGSQIQSIIDAGRAKLHIDSPSKVFAYQGRMIGEGLLVGMQKMERPVLNAAADLAGATMSGFGNPSVAVGGNGGGGNVYHIYALKSDELIRLMQNAEQGGDFARNFGHELGLYAGQS